MNTIELKGQISRIYYGKRNSVLTLYVRGRRTNFPQVVFTGRMSSELDKFAEGDYVSIKACMKVRGERQENGRILHTQFIKGLEIELVDSPAEGENFGYVNEYILNGKIVRANGDNNMVTLLVNPDGEKFNLWAFQYPENVDAALAEFAVGSEISAKCEIQTVRKEIRGEVKFFENVVIKEANVRASAE